MVPRRVLLSYFPIVSLLRRLGYGLICVALFIPYAAASDGTHALDFLNIPVGARSAAVGIYNYAGHDGPELIFANPGLLGSDNAVFASHQELLLDTRSQALSITFSLGRRFVMGLGADIFDPGGINGYSAENVSTGNVPAGERLIRLALARNGYLSYGVSVSHFSQRLDDLSGRGFGMGAGVALKTNYGDFAAAIDNVGPDFKIGSARLPLPSRYSLSASRPLVENKLIVSGAIGYNEARGWESSGGIEYQLVRGLNLLGGSNQGDPLALGLQINSGNFAFYYSYIPLSRFGDRHIFSFEINY